MNSRTNKTLKRKKAYKDWRKKKNIIENYLKQQKNRADIGLPPKRSPVWFIKARKYLSKAEEKILKKETLQEKERVVEKFEKMGWWRKFQLRVLYFLKVIRLKFNI